MNRPARLILSVVVVVGLGVTVGPWVYINFIKDDAPVALDINSVTSSTVESADQSIDTVAAPITDASGDWQVLANTDSVVGYRVKEILFGQATEGVGRTEDVEAALTIEDNVVTAASFTVQMGTLASDSTKRDGQFNGRIMDVATHPTAIFSLTQPITLPANAVSGEVITTDATGELTLRGTTKPVTFPVEAKVQGSTFTVAGNITIVFDEWSIPEPGLPGISVDPQGLLEFALVFTR
jgi:polyisoprenoid-binding protein YceI